MKLAVLSDIHGNLGALAAVLDDIGTLDVTHVVNLGDILSGPLHPAETADRLMQLDIPTIRGNHERQLLDQPLEAMGASDRHTRERLDEHHLEWLRRLPEGMLLDDGVLLTHGAPGNDLQYLLETVSAGGVRPASAQEVSTRLGASRQGLILCGHTHIPRRVQLADGRLVVNPGSVGLQAYHDSHPFPHVMQTGSPEARYAVVESVDDEWAVEFRKVRYDWDAAADWAARHGRRDWEEALRTGCLAGL